MSNLPDISKYFTPEIVSTFAEIQQPRSEFQLEKFVVGAHDTPEMQYFQCITEIQSLYYTLKEVGLNLKKTQIEIDRLRSTKDEIDEIEAQIKELRVEQTQVIAVGAIRELEVLLDIKNKYPNYTRKEIEISQPDYWNKRLNRQAQFEIIAGSSGGAANLTALNQIGVLQNKEIEQ
jgi:hypothetical protein